PKITSRGFVYIKTSKDLMVESRDIVAKIVQRDLDNKEFDWSQLKQDIRENLNNFLYEQTKRHPVILPVIMEINQNNHFSKKKKDYTKTRKLLEKEYLEKKTFRTNYFLFLVFLKIEDYIAAYETANEYIRQYIIDNEKFKKYQKAAIFAGMNVKLQELSNNIFEYTTESEQKEFDKNQQTLLTDYLNKNSKLEIMKQLSYLGIFPLF